MDGFPAPWFVAGGWAIDLYLGRITRSHQDIEIAVFRRDQEAIRSHLRGWSFSIAVPDEGGRLVAWSEKPWLDPPIHEIHVRGPSGPPLEILLNESTGTEWRCRRDRRVARPIDKVGLVSEDDIPYFAPEIVPLFKSKAPRDRDEEDLRNVLPRLAAERIAWLRPAVRACHPESPWASTI